MVLLKQYMTKTALSIQYLVFFVLLLKPSVVLAQTEAWPQPDRWLEWHVWYDGDRPTTDSMVLIPGGKYLLGYDPNDLARFAGYCGAIDKKEISPPREVEIEPFYILNYEVCNKQYLEFVDYTGHSAPVFDQDMEGIWAVNYLFAWQGRAYPPGRAAFPVTSITKADAEVFVNGEPNERALCIACRPPTNGKPPCVVRTAIFSPGDRIGAVRRMSR